MSTPSDADKAKIIAEFQVSAVQICLGNYPEVCSSDLDCFTECPPAWLELLSSRAMAVLIELGLFHAVRRHGRQWWRLVDRAAAKAWLKDNKEVKA